MYKSPIRNTKLFEQNALGMQVGPDVRAQNANPQAFAKAPDIDPPKTPCPPGQSWEIVITVKDGVLYYHYECKSNNSSMNEWAIPGGERMRPHPLKWTPGDPGKLGPIGPAGPGLTGGGGTTGGTTGDDNPACAGVIDYFNGMGCDYKGDYPEGSPCYVYRQIINNLGCNYDLY